MSGPFATPFEELPRELIVFPLPGALLLPRGRLPLNIFEERYLNMVEDALGAKRLIGMIQTREPYSGLVPHDAPLFETGCAGRIVSFSETGDGRILLTLEGVCRYRITGEVEARRGYRRMAVEFDSYSGDLQDSDWVLDRTSFFALLHDYFAARGIEVDWQALERAEDRILVATLGMMCPFDLKEKQALIEADNIDHMTAIMRSLMEMAIQSADQSTAKH